MKDTSGLPHAEIKNARLLEAARAQSGSGSARADPRGVAPLRKQRGHVFFFAADLRGCTRIFKKGEEEEDEEELSGRNCNSKPSFLNPRSSA